MDTKEPQCAARDMSIEGRLSDLENTVRNEIETQRRYWRSVEQGGEVESRTRESLLVRVRSLELGAELYAQSMQEALRQRDERIDTLESAFRDAKLLPLFSHRQELDTLKASDKDRGERQLYWETKLDTELRNVADWVATIKHHGDQIDGLLGDVERNRKLVARIEALEEAERARPQAPPEADRAHGPIEGENTEKCSAPDDLTRPWSDNGWDPDTHATVRSYTSYGQTTHWVKLEDVNALVKAALEAADVMREEGLMWSAGELAEALSPFETQEPSEPACTCSWVEQPDGARKSVANCKRHGIGRVDGQYTGATAIVDTTTRRPPNTAHPSDFEKPGVYADRIVGHVERIGVPVKLTTPTYKAHITGIYGPCPVAGCTLYANHSGKCTGGA